MLLTDVQAYDRGVSDLSISTKTYWWRKILSNGGNLFIQLIVGNDFPPVLSLAAPFTTLKLPLYIVFRNFQVQ